MINRTCIKCGEKLSLNEKLQLMECVSGLHIEPVNLIRAQYWNQCPGCGQMGTNDRDGERYLQALDSKKQPITKKVGDKEYMIVFNENTNQVSVKCKACSYVFTKKGALN